MSEKAKVGRPTLLSKAGSDPKQQKLTFSAAGVPPASGDGTPAVTHATIAPIFNFNAHGGTNTIVVQVVGGAGGSMSVTSGAGGGVDDVQPMDTDGPQGAAEGVEEEREEERGEKRKTRRRRRR